MKLKFCFMKRVYDFDTAWTRGPRKSVVLPIYGPEPGDGRAKRRYRDFQAAYRPGGKIFRQDFGMVEGPEAPIPAVWIPAPAGRRRGAINKRSFKDFDGLCTQDSSIDCELVGIVQGVDAGQRIGNSIHVKQIRFRGFANFFEEGAVIPNVPNLGADLLRFAIVVDHQSNGSPYYPAYYEIFSLGGTDASFSFNAFQNPDNGNRFSILYDEMIALNSTHDPLSWGGMNAGASSAFVDGNGTIEPDILPVHWVSTNCLYEPIEFTIPTDINVSYVGATDGGESIQTNRIFAVVMSAVMDSNNITGRFEVLYDDC